MLPRRQARAAEQSSSVGRPISACGGTAVTALPELYSNEWRGPARTVHEQRSRRAGCVAPSSEQAVTVWRPPCGRVCTRVVARLVTSLGLFSDQSGARLQCSHASKQGAPGRRMPVRSNTALAPAASTRGFIWSQGGCLESGGLFGNWNQGDDSSTFESKRALPSRSVRARRMRFPSHLMERVGTRPVPTPDHWAGSAARVRGPASRSGPLAPARPWRPDFRCADSPRSRTADLRPA